MTDLKNEFCDLLMRLKKDLEKLDRKSRREIIKDLIDEICFLAFDIDQEDPNGYKN